MVDRLVHLVGAHVVLEPHADACDPGQSAHLAADAFGHQEREVRAAPVGGQPEADEDVALLADRDRLDEAEVGQGLVQLGVVDQIEPGPDVAQARRHGFAILHRRHSAAIETGAAASRALADATSTS